MSIEHNDATELSDATGEIDDLDTDLDGTEDAEDLVEEDEALQSYGSEVTSEDLGTQDLLDDGGDLAVELNDEDEQVGNRLDGVVSLDEEIVTDDLTTSESLEDRFQQEEPDPNSSIVPDDAGRRI